MESRSRTHTGGEKVLGQTSWLEEIQARKKDADFIIESLDEPLYEA